jgi:hypothetical protein
MSAYRLLFSALAGVAIALPGASIAATPPSPANAQGGSYQRSSLEGCMNQWLFNGVWRVRVTNVQPVTKEGVNYPGYAVTIETKNGSQTAASWAYTGVSGPVLVLDDGNTLDQGTSSTIAWNNYYYKDIPQSAGFRTTLNYYSDSTAAIGKPSKLLVDVDPKKEGSSAPRYTTRTPSLRVHLDCTK